MSHRHASMLLLFVLGVVAAGPATAAGSGKARTTLASARTSSARPSSAPRGVAWRGERLVDPAGQAGGDLGPVLESAAVAPHAPWVVWSRFNGRDYDLAWSRLSGRDWSPVAWVAAGASFVGDDLDADLAFDARGVPFVTWWSNAGGEGQVFLSTFAGGQWLAPLVISGPGVDSRKPRILAVGHDVLLVEFGTPQGRITQTVQFQRPATITDDINPQRQALDGSDGFPVTERP